MSGGFFRGTSADQDTRFSNKQAKLLKSQKFPPELDHPVDMTKVKMDVIRPWIATRATELLGFEDEVLINFVYGLLEAKQVDGKQIQIQLTGFMEKNTGKFMKELWGLLLSAQNNASGVPQQFLDAKEEEMKKKKAETDKIAEEIHKRKERGGWESEQDKKNRMDGKLDILGPNDTLRNTNAVSDTVVKLSSRRSTSADLEGKEDVDRRRHSRRKSRSSLSPARSGSRSFSNSRSYSGGKSSRSQSGSPSHRRRSLSPERRYRSPRRDSLSPRHDSRSPTRKRSSRLSRHRSPSLVGRGSPRRRRYPSPAGRGSPGRRRSPSPRRYKSPAYPRRRSPFHRRSPPPLRRFPSPSHCRSPMRHRTSRHRSPSPWRRRSPSPSRRRSPLPRSPRRRVYSPMRRKTEPRRSSYDHNRSRSPSGSRSSASPARRSLSRDLDSHSNGQISKTHEDSRYQRVQNRSPVHQISEREDLRSRLEKRRMDSASRKLVSERSVEENEKRIHSSLRSPSRKSEIVKVPADSPETEKREDAMGSREVSERHAKNESNSSDEIEYGPGKMGSENISPDFTHNKEITELGSSPREARLKDPTSKGRRPSGNKRHSPRTNHHKDDDHDSDFLPEVRTKRKEDQYNKGDQIDLGSEDDARYKQRTIEKRVKRSDHDVEAMHDDAGYDSPIGEKEDKRRRKDEKRLRKEERRRKREERLRKKERRAEKKAKHLDTMNPPDYEKKCNADDASDSDVRMRSDVHSSGDEDSQQKRLEIQLREKALQSLRAKKTNAH